MTTFIAVYRGQTVSDAKMVAISADPALVAYVATEILHDPHYAEDAEPDPAIRALTKGRRQALRIIQDFAE